MAKKIAAMKGGDNFKIKTKIRKVFEYKRLLQAHKHQKFRCKFQDPVGF
jgi:hypothetical protein